MANSNDMVSRVESMASGSATWDLSDNDLKALKFVLEERAALWAALKAILDEPHGCPMCDSGKLRNPDKEHFDECGYLLARAAIAKASSK